jgi:hypothetical protein
MAYGISHISVFAPLVKSAPADDGSVMVYGKATGSDLDLDQQRMDAAFLRKAMPEYMIIGNVREQHDARRAIGKAIEHTELADGHYIRAHIVDPVAVKKVNAGVFTGFSVGIAHPVIEKSADAPKGLVTAGTIVEISLVDRPALATATLALCKAAGAGLVRTEAMTGPIINYMAKAMALTDPALIAGYLELHHRTLTKEHN